MAAIEASSLTKTFQLPHERVTSLREGLATIFRPKTYETFLALKDVSFVVRAGEFFGVIGRNGSGKSTLLKLLAGIYCPNRGSVQVNGRVSPFLELGVGFNPELTAKDNVFLNGVVLGLSHREIVRRYRQIVAFAGLEKFMDAKLKNFSSGMQVRLAFSVAIQAPADVFLIDEVLAVGDAEYQGKCFTVFRQLKRAGKTIIFVSHDLGSIQEFCDRVLLLEAGRLLLLDEPTKVIATYQRLTGERIEESREGDKVSSEPGQEVQERELGLGKITITRVDFFDRQGRRRQTFPPGAPFELRIHYRSHTTIERPVVGLAFYNQDGVNLGGPNTKIDGVKLPPLTPRGQGTISYRLADCPFAAGDYDVTVGFFDWDCQIPYTFRDKAFHFQVTPTVPPSVGAIRLKGQWHKQPA